MLKFITVLGAICLGLGILANILNLAAALVTNLLLLGIILMFVSVVLNMKRGG